MDCLFCKIVEGTIPSNKVYEDDKILAFKDITPMAPIHIIIIPKKHFTSILDLNNENINIIQDIILSANKIAEEFGISKSGFRFLTNSGESGGQSVPHLHFHLLGGRVMQWPPG